MKATAQILIALGLLVLIAAAWFSVLANLEERSAVQKDCQIFYAPQKVRVNCP